jgi:hypothetical protein
MVAATDKKPSKTAFVTGHLQKNPKANSKAVNEAWRKAGHPGSVSPTLVSKLRSDLGLAGNLRSRSKTKEGNGAIEAPKASPPKGRFTPKSYGKPRAQANGTHAASAPETKPRSSDRERILEEAEGDIDRLIFKLMDVGGMGEVEEALRRARRMLVRSHAK